MQKDWSGTLKSLSGHIAEIVSGTAEKAMLENYNILCLNLHS